MEETSQSTAPYTIGLVEDDPKARQHISQAIQKDASLQLVGAFGNVTEAKAFLQQQAPRVLLVDLDLPDGNGLELIKLTRDLDGTDSMVITVFEDEYHVITALEMGASGYLLKDTIAETICTNILSLVNGGAPISPMIARTAAPAFSDQHEKPLRQPNRCSVLVRSKSFSSYLSVIDDEKSLTNSS